MEIAVWIAAALFVVSSLLIIFAVLLQEGKGGGLSSIAGGGGQQIIGTSNPLRRLTVILAVAFFLLAGFLANAMGKNASGGKMKGSAGKSKAAIGAPQDGKTDAADKKNMIEEKPPANGNSEDKE